MSDTEKLTKLVEDSTSESLHQTVSEEFASEDWFNAIYALLYKLEVDSCFDAVEFFRETRINQFKLALNKYRKEEINGGSIVRVAMLVLTSDNYEEIRSLIPNELQQSFNQFFDDDFEMTAEFYSLYGRDTIDVINSFKS